MLWVIGSVEAEELENEKKALLPCEARKISGTLPIILQSSSVVTSASVALLQQSPILQSWMESHRCRGVPAERGTNVGIALGEGLVYSVLTTTTNRLNTTLR